MNQINKTVGQLVQSLIKLIQEKLSVSEKLHVVTNSFTQLFHHGGELDIIIFQALQQQQKIILTVQGKFRVGKQIN